ncbi:hypothetical protein DN407_30400 (plasmid) [Bacillus sp. JAS24-2]|nr:hypothetical protein DN407_30400 [Bacillus sp. JAS24-2]
MKFKLGNVSFDAPIFKVLNTCLISGHLQQKKDIIYFTNNKKHVSLYLEPKIIEKSTDKFYGDISTTSAVFSQFIFKGLISFVLRISTL